MSIKKLIILILSSLVLASPPSYSGTLVPLLKDDPYFTVELQKHYVVKTFALPPGGEMSLAIAIHAWNRAARDHDFISYTRGQSSAPHIYVIPMDINGLGGIALPLDPNVCVIQIVPQYLMTPEIYMHEIGHCLGFAHNTRDKDAVMAPHTLRKGPGIDPATTWSLRFLLRLLTN